jgi:hypothetical protein
MRQVQELTGDHGGAVSPDFHLAKGWSGILSGVF